ncbi:MAG: sugar phosphate isomerase/epimerase [Mogibacterium sp.]|nr:sugar phosphate isomerase/epimerase [Mogibacterium sp.]
MSKVKLSVNAPLENAGILKAAGYNYIEPSNVVMSALRAYEFQVRLEEFQKTGVKCRVIDNPLPFVPSFSAPDWRITDWIAHLEISAKRAKALGAEYWCFGNGVSRALKDDKPRGISMYYEAVKACREIGGEQGIKVIVEPLGPSVTNYLQTVEDVVAMIDEAGWKDVYTMVDYRWQQEQDRSIDELYRYADRIVHAHIDDPGTDYAGQKVRRVQKLNDGFDYTDFMEFIKSDSFSGIMSIEANTFDDYVADLKAAMELYHHFGIESAE